VAVSRTAETAETLTRAALAAAAGSDAHVKEGGNGQSDSLIDSLPVKASRGYLHGNNDRSGAGYTTVRKRGDKGSVIKEEAGNELGVKARRLVSTL
jgi:hypothetical protein